MPIQKDLASLQAFYIGRDIYAAVGTKRILPRTNLEIPANDIGNIDLLMNYCGADVPVLIGGGQFVDGRSLLRALLKKSPGYPQLEAVTLIVQDNQVRLCMDITDNGNEKIYIPALGEPMNEAVKTIQYWMTDTGTLTRKANYTDFHVNIGGWSMYIRALRIDMNRNTDPNAAEDFKVTVTVNILPADLKMNYPDKYTDECTVQIWDGMFNKLVDFFPFPIKLDKLIAASGANSVEELKYSGVLCIRDEQTEEKIEQPSLETDSALDDISLP